MQVQHQQHQQQQQKQHHQPQPQHQHQQQQVSDRCSQVFLYQLYHSAVVHRNTPR